MKRIDRSRELLSNLSKTLPLCLLLTGCGSLREHQPVAVEESASASGGRPIFTRHTEAEERVVAYIWQEGSQFVRIEKEESGAGPHSHSVSLTPEQIVGALGRIRIGTSDGKQLFTVTAIETLASPLAKALAKATVDQEVTFAITYRLDGMGYFMSRRVTTGRLFMSDNGLNLIVGLLQTPFEDEMRATGYRIPFIPGSRNRRVQKGWSLATSPPAAYPTSGRHDWIRIDFNTGTKQPPTASTLRSPATSGSNTENDQYHRLEQRLEVLKHLRKKGLISKEAYQLKSRQILDEL